MPQYVYMCCDMHLSIPVMGLKKTRLRMRIYRQLWRVPNTHQDRHHATQHLTHTCLVVVSSNGTPISIHFYLRSVSIYIHRYITDPYMCLTYLHICTSRHTHPHSRPSSVKPCVCVCVVIEIRDRIVVMLDTPHI